MAEPGPLEAEEQHRGTRLLRTLWSRRARNPFPYRSFRGHRRDPRGSDLTYREPPPPLKQTALMYKKLCRLSFRHLCRPLGRRRCICPGAVSPPCTVPPSMSVSVGASAPFVSPLPRGRNGSLFIQGNKRTLLRARSGEWGGQGAGYLGPKTAGRSVRGRGVAPGHLLVTTRGAPSTPRDAASELPDKNLGRSFDREEPIPPAQSLSYPRKVIPGLRGAPLVCE